MSSFSATVLQEPHLIFGYNQLAAEPHDGLTIFGPYDSDAHSHPKNLSYAVISTTSGRKKIDSFLQKLKQPIQTTDMANNALWPLFPGFENIFSTLLPSGASCYMTIEMAPISVALKKADRFQRVGEVVEMYFKQVKKISSLDERIDLIYCVVPDEVFRDCRPESRVLNPTGKSPSKKEVYQRKYQGSLFLDYNPDYYFYFPDFRRQMKARSMEYGIPIQIIRESTLAITKEEKEDAFRKYKRQLTPLSDRAWNISTASYYKIGGKPWQLADARDGVCYIGLTYKIADTDDNNRTSACCAAQLFLKDGDGVVFKSDEGIIYSPEKKMFHMSRDGAKKIIFSVLSEYYSLGKPPLKEIFIHCSSEFSEEEYLGFQEVCPKGAKVVAVRVKKERFFRAYRKETRPVVRGTFVKESERSGYLWCSGFKYDLQTYDGTECPVPLRVTVQYGDADIETIAKDILSLSKLNYNTCKHSMSYPVTIGFASAVGEILISNNNPSPRPQFKYYI